MVPEQVRDDARRALAQVDCNTGFAAAVLEGRVAGELWADGPAAARAFHVVHPCGMSLVWGPAVADAAEPVVRRIMDRAADGHGEWLQVEPRWHGVDWDALLGAVPLDAAGEGPSADGPQPDAGPRVVRRTRLNFELDPGAVAAASSPGRTDPSVRVRRATAQDFDWPGGTVPHHFWPDAGEFLAHGGGRVAEVDREPAAICFAAFSSADTVELGVETSPAWRRRGLAQVVAGAMVTDLLAAGRTPVWSCREDNTGSVRLAHRCGFRVSRRLPYYEVRGACR